MKTFFVALLLAALVPLCSARAEDYPTRKAGLWEIKTVDSHAGPGGGAHTMMQCIDADSDKKLQEMGKSMGGNMGLKCDKMDSKREGDKFVTESSCKMGPTTVSSKSVISGDFNSAYSGETTASYNPPLMGMTNNVTKMTATYKGACAADQKPGDMIVEGGMKMNVFDMAAGFANGPKADLSKMMEQIQKNSSR